MSRARARGRAGAAVDGSSAAPLVPGSLEALEGLRWPEPASDATRLTIAAHALRRRPVPDLGVEELRLLIGQAVGLPHLLPRAVDLLCRDPLVEGDLHPGDLLSAVLRCDPAVWDTRPDLAGRLAVVLRESVRTAGEEPGGAAGTAGVPREVWERVGVFLGGRPEEGWAGLVGGSGKGL
ncbi:contact-dependent growth inhibition system immunity protein [Kitasatospora sp. NPDC093806]|uniref:contact-dependent growth inhibition system immunity protein n=1 Tax=Kitasatospora sp. NPDC093806 TaxID=3155075 RepID=UPI00341B9FFC